MTDEQIADVLLEILDDGMFNDIYMRGDHNKNELRLLMTERGVTNDQVTDIQERFEIQAEVTFTEVLAYLIENLNPGIHIP
jgi:autonomous glycyl radical cofactor GrcA